MLSALYPTMVEAGGLFGDAPHEGHLGGVEAIFADEAVMRWLGGTRPPGAARAFIARERSHWREHRFGIWLFRDLETGAFAGWGGIRRCRVAGEAAVELAYALVPAQWHQGRATAIGKLAVQLGFENLGLAEIVCFTWTENGRSEAVMRRVGFAFDRHIEHAGLPHVLYRCGAADFARMLEEG